MLYSKRRDTMKKVFVFGYGSLMSEKGLQKTLPQKRATRWTTLSGWKAIFNKVGQPKYDGEPVHLYLNIIPIPDEKGTVRGVLIQVNPKELELLKARELGYDLVDVTRQIYRPPTDSCVLTFVAPHDTKLPKNRLFIRKSYLNRCLADMSPGQQKQWLKETDLQGAEIEEDC